MSNNAESNSMAPHGATVPINASYVIVGAGHAARRAAETLRQRDASIRIAMIGDEREYPYDRPVLSKDALIDTSGEGKAFVRDPAWYSENRIDVRLGVRVEIIDRAQRRIHLADGTAMSYHRLLIATGSRVRRFSGPMDAAAKLHYVRTLADARALRAALFPESRVAIIGGGFVGLEVAASARARGCEVTVVDTAERLLQRSMPADVGHYIRALHHRHGVHLLLSTQTLAIRHGSVETDRGVIDADVIVMGIGIEPNVELASAAGLLVGNGIVVDAECRTLDPFIFAAGEVTNHLNPLIDKQVRVESWQVAENQPAVAAENMLGGSAQYAEIPWLWSDQYDCNVQTLGSFDPAQHIVVRGEIGSSAFLVFGMAASGVSRLLAVAAVNMGREVAVCRRLMQAGQMMDPAVLSDVTVSLRQLLQRPATSAVASSAR